MKVKIYPILQRNEYNVILDSSVSDRGNSFEDKNEEHSVIPTASETEILFPIGGRSKFGRTIRHNSKFLVTL